MPGTIVEKHVNLSNVGRILLACTASTAGVFPDTILKSKFSGRLFAITTKSGTTPPTNLYDITLIDELGVDVLYTAGSDRVSATPTTTPIMYLYNRYVSGQGATFPVVIEESKVLTIKFANNSVPSAQTTVELVYAKGV